MERVTSGALGDLLATTESVGDDEPVVRCFAHRGEKLEFADGAGDVVVLAMEAEGSGHPTAAGSGRLEVDAEAAQERLFSGHLHHRFVVAVAVEQGLARKLRERGTSTQFLFEEFAEQESLLAQGLSACIVRKEVDQFVAEDGDAAGFESDDGDAGFDFGLELVEDFEQKAFGAVEHAEVVEGASATEVRLGNEDAESGGLENFDGGAGGRGQEVVVEGVGPEENRLR